jgi:hypothetical protein
LVETKKMGRIVGKRVSFLKNFVAVVCIQNSYFVGVTVRLSRCLG